MTVAIFTHFLPAARIHSVGAWLKELDSDTLRSHFGLSLSANGIDHLISKWERDTNHHFLIANHDYQWAGLLHIATLEDAVEFGVIVRKQNRRCGIADRLVSEGITWAQNRNYRNLFMHCVAENHAIQRLCRKNHLTFRNSYGDIEGSMQLPRVSWKSLFRETVQRQANWYFFARAVL